MSDFAPTGQIKSIFSAFKDAAWFTKYSTYLLAIGLAVTYSNRFLGGSESFSQSIDRLVIISCLMLLLIGSLIRETIIRRDRRFANIQSLLHDVFHRNRNLYTYLNDAIRRVDAGEINARSSLKDCESLAKGELTKILDGVSKAFSILSGTTCRASIKGMAASEEDYAIFTWARDSESQSGNYERDQKRFAEKLDMLSTNSDFSMILVFRV